MSVGRDTSAANTREIQNQIMITRGMDEVAPGTIHWNISSLIRNPALAEGILNGPYKEMHWRQPAPWLDNKIPAAPAVTHTITGDSLQINWQPAHANETFRSVVYFQYGSRKLDYLILNQNDHSIRIPLLQDEKAKLLLTEYRRYFGYTYR